MTPGERRVLAHRKEVDRLRRQSGYLTRGELVALCTPFVFVLLLLLALAVAGCSAPGALTSDGDDWDESCRNPVTGQGAGVPIYGSDC